MGGMRVLVADCRLSAFDRIPNSDIARAWLKTKVSDPVVLPNGRKLGLYVLAGIDFH
jgi:hypothetical protein